MTNLYYRQKRRHLVSVFGYGADVKSFNIMYVWFAGSIFAYSSYSGSSQ